MLCLTTPENRRRPWPLLVLALFALAGSGCVTGIPRIDPTGRGLLVVDPPAGSSSITTIPPPPTGAAVPGTVTVVPPTTVVTPAPAAPIVTTPAPPVVLPSPGVTLALAPADTIAPVGSEVILVASVAGSESVLQPRQRIEWTLAPSGVGQIATISQTAPLDWLFGGRGAQKLAANYAVSSTSTRNYLLNRGTAIVTDDIPIVAGQTWVSVTSAVEGISHVSALAPQLGAWEARQKNARIYWVDAQWSFPPAITAPAGGRQTLSTSILRLSDRTPLAGYVVRYSITGGAPASLGGGDAQEVEVTTNAAGEAIAEISQLSPTGGATEIRMAIIRPSSLGGFDGRTLDVATGITRVTWGGDAPIAQPAPIEPAMPVPSTPAAPARPQLSMRVSTPIPAFVGDEVTFVVTLTNIGTVATGEMKIEDEYGPGLVHESGTNPAKSNTNLPSLAPGQETSFNLYFTVDAIGQLRHRVSVFSLDGQLLQSAEGVVAVTDPPPATLPPDETPYEPATPAPEANEPPPATSTAREGDLAVEISGPLRARRGEKASFTITVTNNGPTDLHDVQVLNQFDGQLTPLQVSKKIPHRRTGTSGLDILWDPIATLAPGASQRFAVVYRCEQPAESACAYVTVTCRENLRVDDQACLAIEAANTDLKATLSDQRDPVAVGSVGTYELRLKNNSDIADMDIRVTITLPPELEFVATGTMGPGRVGATAVGNQIEFQPLSTLAASEEVSYYLAAKGRQVGLARVSASVTSAGSPTAVTAAADTQIVAGRQ